MFSLCLFVGVFVCLFVCLSVRKQDYLKSTERICMKLLPEVCHRPMTNPINLGDDPDYDPDPGSFYQRCLGVRNNPLIYAEVCSFVCTIIIYKFDNQNIQYHLIYMGMHSPQQTPDVESVLVQCWATVCDAGPALNQHWLNAYYLSVIWADNPLM